MRKPVSQFMRAYNAFLHVLRRVSGDQRGAIAVTTALTLPVLLGFGGMAVDASMWLRAKSSVQGAADASAFSTAAAHGSPSTRLQDEGKGAAAANGYVNGQNGVAVTVNNPPASGAYAANANAYEVIITAPQQLYLTNYFAEAFGFHAPTEKGRAVALLVETPITSPMCILSLDTTAVTAPKPNPAPLANSGSSVLLAHCDIDVNSTSGQSIQTSGSSSITGADVNTAGTFVVGTNVHANPGTVNTRIIPVNDPYATTRSIPALPAFQPSSANTWSGHITNPTGVKAFNGNVSANNSAVTLDPGVYIISNGKLDVSRAITGTGVTIILTGTAHTTNEIFTFGGGATFNLTAPTTGTTAGIVLWVDGRLGLNTSGFDSFNGGSASTIKGAIYAPSHKVSYTGSTVAGAGCTQIVAWDILLTGSATFNHDCTGVGTLDPVTGTKFTWSLVE